MAGPEVNADHIRGARGAAERAAAELGGVLPPGRLRSAAVGQVTALVESFDELLALMHDRNVGVLDDDLLEDILEDVEGVGDDEPTGPEVAHQEPTAPAEQPSEVDDPEAAAEPRPSSRRRATRRRRTGSPTPSPRAPTRTRPTPSPATTSPTTTSATPPTTERGGRG